MGFQQGLSGLNASSKSLEAIGNNISNSGTVGFKSAAAQFADVYAASLAGGGSSQVGIGTSVGAVAQQFTQGNITTTNNSLDVAINGSGFFRMQSPAGTVSYTRNGQFQLDKNGFIVNSSGSQLTGYLANTQGIVVPSTPTNIQINTSDLQPVATGTSASATGLVLGLNLDSRKLAPSASIAGSVTGGSAPTTTVTTAATYSAVINGVSTGNLTLASGAYTTASLAAAVQTAINAALPSGTSVTVGVSTAPATSGSLVFTANPGGLGSSVAITDTSTNTLLGTGTPTTVAGADNFSIANPLSYTSSTSATVYDSLGNSHVLGIYFVKAATANQYNVYTNLDGGTPAAAKTITFSSIGAPSPAGAFVIPQNFAVTTGANALSFNLDLSSSTQYGSLFGVNSTTQDGYASGRLSGLSISADGTVQGKYSNGQTRNLAQVVLCTFKNANGLQSLGGNQWEETATSGQPLTGVPGSGANGVLQSSAVEESNTDLTAELVNMITQQRAYQANAQTIKTQDQILQTLVNLR